MRRSILRNSGATVSAELVDAAVRAARERGQDVAEVPLGAIAAEAGISRSTLLRRIGGSRQGLHDALRESGIDPGGRPPVRERAIEAAARLISDHGLAFLTLEAVAREAECSLPSLYVVFEGRDGLLTAVFERYSPVRDLERIMADPPDDLEETVRAVYRALVTAAGRRPRVMPALLADLFGNPSGPARPVWERQLLPRILASMGSWLIVETRAGRLRPLPLPLLAQLLIGPLLMHVMTRPVVEPVFRPDYPGVEQACEVFTHAFLRAAAVPDPAAA